MGNSSSIIELKLDAGEIDVTLSELSLAFVELQENVSYASIQIADMFYWMKCGIDDVTNNMGEIITPLEKVFDTIGSISQWDSDTVVRGLEDIASALGDINIQLEQQQKQDLWTSLLSTFATVTSLGKGIGTNRNGSGKKSSSNSGGGKYLRNTGDSDMNPLKFDTGAEIAVGLVSELTSALDSEAVAAALSTAAGLAHSAATAAWNAVCSAATAVTGAFGAALSFLTSPIGLVILGITALIAIIVLLVMNWDTVCQALARFDEWLTGVFAVDWTEQFGAFGEVLNAFFANVESIWNAVKTIFEGIVQFVTGVFSGDWQSAWEGIVQVFTGIWEGLQAAIKAPINGVIGLINGLISAVVSGINSAIDAFNALRFTVPDWVPGIGGESIGFNIGKISAPRIPLLAQGAVLPANRPFLAVVGDQKSGTNVEAPLATIQEALANVLARQGAGDITITFAGDLAQLGRVLKPVIDRENRRVGGNLARGAV